MVATDILRGYTANMYKLDSDMKLLLQQGKPCRHQGILMICNTTSIMLISSRKEPEP